MLVFTNSSWYQLVTPKKMFPESKNHIRFAFNGIRRNIDCFKAGKWASVVVTDNTRFSLERCTVLQACRRCAWACRLEGYSAVMRWCGTKPNAIHTFYFWYDLNPWSEGASIQVPPSRPSDFLALLMYTPLPIAFLHVDSDVLTTGILLRGRIFNTYS